MEQEKLGYRLHSRSTHYDSMYSRGRRVYMGNDIQRHWTVSDPLAKRLRDGIVSPALKTLHIRFSKGSNGEWTMVKDVTYS